MIRTLLNENRLIKERILELLIINQREYYRVN